MATTKEVPMPDTKGKFMSDTVKAFITFAKNPLLGAVTVLSFCAILWVGTCLNMDNHSAAADTQKLELCLTEVRTELRLVKERQGENWQAVNAKLDRIMDIIMAIQKDMR